MKSVSEVVRNRKRGQGFKLQYLLLLIIKQMLYKSFNICFNTEKTEHRKLLLETIACIFKIPSCKCKFRYY